MANLQDKIFISWTQFYIIICLGIVKFCYCYEIDLTFELPAAKLECFYQNVREKFILEVEYQVLDGGDLDVSFMIQDPNGLPLVTEKMKQEGVHAVTSKLEGVYKLCFDNSFSSFSSKLIYFEVIVESDQGEDYYDELEMKRLNFTEEDDVESYQMTIEDIQESLSRLKSSLSKMVHFQESRRAVEARHRNLAENNFGKVNTWSALQSAMMIGVGLMQVYTIRSLFDEKNILHKLMVGGGR